MVIIEWSIIEPNLGIICACIPVIHRPFITLVVKYWPHVLQRGDTISPQYVQRTAQGSVTAPVNHNSWYPLESFEVTEPTRITSVLTRPQAHKDDEESVTNSTSTKKTTDISLHYDR